MPVVPFRSIDMSDLTESEAAALASLADYRKRESGYSTQQATKPQTLGYGLVDSPVCPVRLDRREVPDLDRL